MDIITKYKLYIYERYNDLLKLGKTNEILNNYDLAKIFEYYSCIKLTEELKQFFYEYSDIEPNYKELHHLSRNDTGIDACNMLDTIVQCKLRENSLSWKECATFFGSQNIYCEIENKPIVKWKNLIITRNSDCKLSDNLLHRQKLFIDKTYDKKELIKYCENLKKPKFKQIKEDINIRDYQLEVINIITNMNNNQIINLPTGTGKNFIIAHCIEPIKYSYLIFVPRILLMEQIESEIIKYKPEYKKYIQKIGDGNNTYKNDFKITICVYNSVKIIDEHINDFNYIIVDEAHHILIPEIYKIDNDDYYSDEDIDNDSDIDSDDDNDIDYEEDIDTEDINNKRYLQLIKSYQKYNNNIYLSATIDKTDGFNYYSKDIREMIENNYLCDYIIKIPIFTDDPTNKNICEYLIKNYRNIIIYCNSQIEGQQINKIMNSLYNNCSSYIDCNTTKTIRNKIINKYKSGELPFLVNVRILVEGFDAPITKGICFMHMPSSKTTLIQIIGRALRLHPEKTYANIILPFSNKTDEESINNFMKTMARNDSKIRNSYMTKSIGGYIDIINTLEEDENDNNDINNNILLKYELLYDKMGLLNNYQEIWEYKLEEVKKYIDENNKRPSTRDKDNNIKKLGRWIGTQLKNYPKKEQIMINDIIREKWENFINDIKYNKYFLSNEEEWLNKLEEVKKYIDENNKRPSAIDKDNNIKKLGNWIGHQVKNYSKKKEIMKNDMIRGKKWEEFINNIKYKTYFLSNEDEWINKLDKVKKYIDDNNKIPSYYDKYNKINTLGKWISHQNYNYSKKEHMMKNDIIRGKWEEFINDIKYNKYFLSNEEIWINTLEIVKKYIDENNNRPSHHDKDNNIKKLGAWLSQQITYYSKKEYIMKNDIIRGKWEEFINSKYKIYFLSNEEEWLNKLEIVKKYINDNNKKPSRSDKDNNIKILGNWIGNQLKNYSKKKEIMKNDIIRLKWEEFISKYKKHFSKTITL